MKATELFFIVAAAAACCAAATLPVDERHTFGPPFWSGASIAPALRAVCIWRAPIHCAARV